MIPVGERNSSPKGNWHAITERRKSEIPNTLALGFLPAPTPFLGPPHSPLFLSYRLCPCWPVLRSPIFQIFPWLVLTLQISTLMPPFSRGLLGPPWRATQSFSQTSLCLFAGSNGAVEQLLLCLLCVLLSSECKLCAIGGIPNYFVHLLNLHSSEQRSTRNSAQ